MTGRSKLEQAAERQRRTRHTPPAARPILAYTADATPIIHHDQGRLPEVCDAALAALAARPDFSVCAFAGGLVCVIPAVAATDGPIKRHAGAVLLHPVTVPLLVELLTRAARHEKFDARTGTYRPCDCPRRVAETILARGSFPMLPQLRGLIETPTIDLDGRIVDVPGYDAKSGLFCAFDQISGYIRPKPAPSRAEAQAALGRLIETFQAFPFVGDEDRAAMAAALNTALLRRVLPAAPMFAISAPAPGTGKTLLAETLALLATGRRAAVMSLGHDDAETEKRLAGMLLAGDPMITIDNIERPLRGDLLCQMATQTAVRLRPLGGSGMRDLPTNSLLVATGNNLLIVGDLKRRTVLIRLDAHVERPERRRFANDHLAEIVARRGQMIHDGLTITLAYLAAGAPEVSDFAYGGFEHWDRLVRRPLLWLGHPDPLLTAESLRDTDPDLEAARMLLGAWYEIVRPYGDPRTTAEILELASEVNPALRDALHVVCAEKPNSRRLGNWLRLHRDRIIAVRLDERDYQLQLQSAGCDRKGFARWRVVEVSGADSADSADSLSS